METAAHVADHVLPRLPVCHWVLSVPKRLRYFIKRDGVLLNMVLRAYDMTRKDFACEYRGRVDRNGIGK